MAKIIYLEEYKKRKDSLPKDYEPCGYCGFDHSYEYEAARKWHLYYDPEGEIYK